MWASPYSVALLNLGGLLSERSAYFMSKAFALDWLKQHTNQDFGYDVLAWERWGYEHDEFYPGWTGIGPMLDEENPPPP